MRVLGISGSLRAASHNGSLVRSAEALLPPGAELRIYEGLREIPPFDEDLEHAPPDAVSRFRAEIEAADALLISTPEYNHSIPGQLKNALDWASRPAGESALAGKPVLVVGASTGIFGAVWAQAELRKVLTATGARMLEGELAVGSADQRFDQRQTLEDAELRERFEALLAELVGAAQPALIRAA